MPFSRFTEHHVLPRKSQTKTTQQTVVVRLVARKLFHLLLSSGRGDASERGVVETATSETGVRIGRKLEHISGNIFLTLQDLDVPFSRDLAGSRIKFSLRTLDSSKSF